MQLTIKPPQQQIIEATLRAGRFQSADEVVAHALELLREQEGYDARREELRRDILVGAEQADRGECTPWDKEAFLKRMRREYDERQNGGGR